MLDIRIDNGKILDGTGNPWRRASVGVRDGRITEVGVVKEAARRIVNAKGCVVCPGFVDVHTHAEEIVSHRYVENFLRQGITTVIAGNCGYSAFPIGELLGKVEAVGPAVNFATLVGHGEIRKQVLDMSPRSPKRSELARMQKLAEQAMRDGAVGMSTGLFYVPGAYARIRELVEVSRAIAACDGIYVSHKRSAGGKIFEALEEMAVIGRRAKTRIHVSHLKVLHRSGRTKKNRVDEVLGTIARYRDSGIEMTCDGHPFGATYTWLSSVVIPPWVATDGKLQERLRDKRVRQQIRGDVLGNIGWVGGPDRIVIVESPEDRSLQGRTLQDVARKRKHDTARTAMDLAGEGEMLCVFHALRPEDVSRVVTSPLAMIASDGEVVAAWPGLPHPRSLGAFPRVLREYVREKKLLRLSEAIRKMTSYPATTFGIPDRGILAAGKKADIVVLDPKKVAERSTFETPRAYPVGIRKVLVNGHIAWDGRAVAPRTRGEVIRKS